MVDLKDLNISISTNIAICFISFVAPGFLIVYLLNHELFGVMEFWKLFIFASAITLPTFLFTLLFTVSMRFELAKGHAEHVEKWGGPREWFIRLGFGNSLSMYTLALIIWWFDLGVRGFIVGAIFTVVLNIVAEFYYFINFIRNPSEFKHGWLSALTSLLR